MRFTESDIDEMVFMAKKFGSYRRAAKELGFNHQSVIDHCHERGLHIPGPHEKCKQHMKKKIVDGFVFYWEKKGYYRGSVNGERMTLPNYIYLKIFGTNKPKGLTIIFKDGDHENYSLDNVEFVTVSEFMRIRHQDVEYYNKNVKMLEEFRKKNKLLEEKKPWLKNRRCKRSWVTRRQRDPDNLSAKKGAATKAANAAKKGFYFTPESRQRMSVAHKGITKLMRAAMIRQREKDALARKMGMV